MKFLPYKNKFSGWVAKFSKQTSSFEFPKVVEQLQSLEELISVDSFVYSSHKDELEGRHALLNLWRQLMELVEVVPSYRQDLFYSMIFSIITRYEFDLIHISSSSKKSKARFRESSLSMSDEVLVRADPEYLEIFKLYKRLLVTQTSKALDSFDQKHSSKVVRRFCSQVLSVAYFRLPVLSGTIINACSLDPFTNRVEIKEVHSADEGENFAKADGDPSTVFHEPMVRLWAKRGRDDEWYKKLQERLMQALEDVIVDNTKLEVEDRIGTSEFFRANPTLFQWTLLFENDDRILVDKACVLAKLSQEKLFFKFVSRLISHVNDVLHVSGSSLDSISDDLTSHEPSPTDPQEEGDADEAQQFFQYDAEKSIRWGLIPGYWSLVRAVLTRSLVRYHSVYPHHA